MLVLAIAGSVVTIPLMDLRVPASVSSFSHTIASVGLIRKGDTLVFSPPLNNL